MITLVKESLKFYFEKKVLPKIEELQNINPELLEKKGGVFVTIFDENMQVIGSKGSFKETEENTAKEIISNLNEIIKDKKFIDAKITSIEKIKVRIDEIEKRNHLKDKNSVEKINPKDSGILVLKPDYSKIAVILPNISDKIKTGADFFPILKGKLGEDFVETKFINYELLTKQTTDF